MIALQGTLFPPLEEIISKGPAPYETTKSIYYNFVLRNNSNHSVEISGLTA